jgi:hypothetical protein
LEAAAGGVPALNLRGVKPGELKAVFNGKTMDKGETLIFWGHEVEGVGGDEDEDGDEEEEREVEEEEDDTEGGVRDLNE